MNRRDAIFASQVDGEKRRPHLPGYKRRCDGL